MSSWFSRPINIVVTVVAAFMTVVAIVSIIWGVMHHEEAGLLQVCEDDGIIIYEPDSVENAWETEADHDSCERTTELRWAREQIPLTIASFVTAQQSMVPDSPQIRILKQVVDDFNQQVRFELFRMGTGLDTTDVEARFGGMLEKAGGDPPSGREMVSPPGYVIHKRVDGKLRAYLFIRSDVSAVDRLLYVVLQHELGHVVGLAHDDFEMSLMYPLTRDDSMDARLTITRLTDYDVRLLRGLYHLPTSPVSPVSPVPLAPPVPLASD